MSSLFPLRDTVTREADEPRLVDLDDETADEVFEALASGTTRDIFLELHREPQTASDLATVTDTSVQNIQYHLEKLTDADLVEVVDTWYSARGSEMDVYAPTDESLVLFAGDDTTGSLRSILGRLAGVFALLLPASAAIGLATNWWIGRSGDRAADSGPAIATEDAGGDDAAGAAADAATESIETLFGLDPALAAGLLFLLGGLFVLVVALSVQRFR
ncbi:MAG: helix-turn-helix domain-containing protein [Halovenus sp.]